MEHLTDQQIFALRTRNMPADEAFALLQHSAICSLCGERVVSRREMAMQVAGLEDTLAGFTAHLSLDEMSDLVEGSLPEQETTRLNEHVDACASCAACVLSMRAESQTGVTTPVTRSRFGEWLTGLLSFSYGLGAVATALIVVTLSGWLWLRHRTAEREVAAGASPVVISPGTDTARNSESATGSQKLPKATAPGKNETGQAHHEEKGRSALLAIALMPGIVRGEGSGKVVHLPSEADGILLTLKSREELLPGRYRVTVSDGAGHTRWRHEARYGRSPEAITVRIPAQILPGGRYIVRLSEVESGEQLDEYAMVIQK